MKKIATHYDVGFGKPPKETQFKKGQSGNPAGRPKGSRNKPKWGPTDQLNKLLIAEAYRNIRINDDAGPVTVPMMEAIIRSMAVKAAKGDHRSQKLFVGAVQKVEAESVQIRSAIMEKLFGYKIDAEREIERRKNHGIDCSDIIPHPDDIGIDLETGMPTLLGPFTPSEKKNYEETYKVICDFKEKLDQAEESLETETDEDERAELEDLIEICRTVIRRLDKKINGWRPKD